MEGCFIFILANVESSFSSTFDVSKAASSSSEDNSEKDSSDSMGLGSYFGSLFLGLAMTVDDYI
jgi:hypothetical protein